MTDKDTFLMDTEEKTCWEVETKGRKSTSIGNNDICLRFSQLLFLWLLLIAD
jgi:hypothetical protein